MFPSGIEQVVAERQKELLREAEQRRLVKLIEGQKTNDHLSFWQILNWFGRQMERWGLKLQQYSFRAAAHVKNECSQEIKRVPTH